MESGAVDAELLKRLDFVLKHWVQFASLFLCGAIFLLTRYVLIIREIHRQITNLFSNFETSSEFEATCNQSPQGEPQMQVRPMLYAWNARRLAKLQRSYFYHREALVLLSGLLVLITGGNFFFTELLLDLNLVLAVVTLISLVVVQRKWFDVRYILNLYERISNQPTVPTP